MVPAVEFVNRRQEAARLARASQRRVISGLGSLDSGQGGRAQARAGGWGGIRTPGRLAPTAVFKTAALNHSATHPNRFAPTPALQAQIWRKTIAQRNDYLVLSNAWLGCRFKFQDRCLKPLGHPSNACDIKHLGVGRSRTVCEQILLGPMHRGGGCEVDKSRQRKKSGPPGCSDNVRKSRFI